MLAYRERLVRRHNSMRATSKSMLRQLALAVMFIGAALIFMAVDSLKVAVSIQ